MEPQIRKKLRKRPNKPHQKVSQKGEWTHEQRRSVLNGIIRCHTRYQLKTERLREHLVHEIAEYKRHEQLRRESMLEEVNRLPFQLTEERRLASLKKLYEEVDFLGKLTQVIQNRLKKG